MLQFIMNFFLFSLMALSLSFCLSGCMISYLVKSTYYQAQILNSRQPIEEYLTRSNLNEEVKRKLKLILDVKKFTHENLNLKLSENYQTYVELDQPYVTYLLRVSEKNQVKSYEWWFPFMGRFPYLGFFKESDAQLKEQDFKDLYDTSISGVSAYSTLGWFNDPVLSSMLSYEDFDLVSLIIHETIHENLFIKNQVDFNEPLAEFLGEKGALLYYQDKSKDLTSKIFQKLEEKQHDKKIFYSFILKEIKNLNEWYSNQTSEDLKEKKQERLKQIQTHFRLKIKPQLKGNSFFYFEKIHLNNAKLLPYLTYQSHGEEFDRIFNLCKNFNRFYAFIKTFEKLKNPIKSLYEIKDCTVQRLF